MFRSRIPGLADEDPQLPDRECFRHYMCFKTQDISEEELAPGLDSEIRLIPIPL